MSFRLRTALSIVAWVWALAAPASAFAQLGMLVESVVHRLGHPRSALMTHSITDSPQGMVPVLSLRDLSEMASEVPIVVSGVASLRMSLTPNPTTVEHFVRDPADLLNLIGALDLRAAGEPIVVYFGVGLGAGPYYRVPSVVVNSTAGIAVRMAMGIDVEVAPRLSLGAAVDAVGLFRAQRDAWSLIATDSAQRGASVLPVHARLRLLL